MKLAAPATRGQGDRRPGVSVDGRPRALRGAFRNATSRSGAAASRILRVATLNQGIWIAGAVVGVTEIGRTFQLYEARATGPSSVTIVWRSTGPTKEMSPGARRIGGGGSRSAVTPLASIVRTR